MGYCLAGASLPGARSRNGDFPSPVGWSCSHPSPPSTLRVWQGYGIAHSMQVPVKRRGHPWYGPKVGRGSLWTPRSQRAWMWTSPQRRTRYKIPWRASP